MWLTINVSTEDRKKHVDFITIYVHCYLQYMSGDVASYLEDALLDEVV